jgi:sialic acid synthase SpsE
LKFSGCDAVKFQKRTIEDVYSKEELDKPRESPWGKTNRDQKNGLEFSEKDYDEINRYCKKNFWCYRITHQSIIIKFRNREKWEND